MRSKAEASALRKQFYTGLGKRMKLHQSASFLPVKWLNYKTGVAHVYFRLEADNKVARVCIDLQHPDEGISELFWEQFLEFKKLLEGALGDDLIWHDHYTFDSGKSGRRICTELHERNLFNPLDWPALYDFFEAKLLALDDFWSDCSLVFKELDS